MSKDVFNKIINIVCIIIGVIALAFAITACCLINDDSEKVTVESITADDAGNIVVTYTDDTVVIIPLVAGEDGKSAYELYVESVPEDEEPMTEAEWLASLKGTNGTNGTNGADGEDGADGKSAYEIYVATVPEGETPMTETEWLESLKGQDGVNGADGENGADGLTPFIGENGNWWIGDTDTGIAAQGNAGSNGVNGNDGKSAYEIYVATVPEGETPMTETEWLESLKGQDGNGIKDILFIGGELVFILDDGTMYHFDINEENDTVMPEL